MQNIWLFRLCRYTSSRRERIASRSRQCRGQRMNAHQSDCNETKDRWTRRCSPVWTGWSRWALSSISVARSMFLTEVSMQQRENWRVYKVCRPGSRYQQGTAVKAHSAEQRSRYSVQRIAASFAGAWSKPNPRFDERIAWKREGFLRRNNKCRKVVCVQIIQNTNKSWNQLGTDLGPTLN